MNSKQKANQLFDKFYLSVSNIYDSLKTPKEIAKENSLICINEILENCVQGVYFDKYGTSDYWEEVKQEIKKL